MRPQNQNSRLLQLTHLNFVWVHLVRLCKCFTNSSSTLVWVRRREWGSAAVDNQRYSRVASTRQGPRILGWMTPPTDTPNFYGFAFACAKAWKGESTMVVYVVDCSSRVGHFNGHLLMLLLEWGTNWIQPTSRAFVWVYVRLCKSSKNSASTWVWVLRRTWDSAAVCPSALQPSCKLKNEQKYK